MKLRHLFGGLMAAACLVVGISGASATTRIPANGLDEVVWKSGAPSLIIQGTCTSATPTTVSFPGDSSRTLPAIEYVFKDALVLKGNSEYQASNSPQEVRFKMYAGEMKDFPRPIPGNSYTLILYGKSAIGLTSVAFGDQGFFPEVEEGGTTVVDTRGLVFHNQNVQQKFLGRNPGNSKYLLQNTSTGEAGPSAEKVTPAVLRDAIQVILQGDK